MDQKRERGNLDGWRRRRSVGRSSAVLCGWFPFWSREGGRGEKEEPGRKETRREKKRREEDVLFFLVTISPSSSLAVNAPPRPSLPFGGNQSCGDHDKSVWRMEDVQRRKKGKEGKDLIHRLRARASMLLFSQEVPFNRARDGMNK